MAVRNTLSSLLSRAVEARVREWIAASNAELQARLDRGEARVAALEEENERLKKKVTMATGAVQAATAELMKLKGAAEEGRNLASQAMQRATSALSAAEAAAEGVTALEQHAAAQLDSSPYREEAEPEPEAAVPSSEGCLVPGCGEPRRAKGYCAKHYQQWKRGTLVAG